MCRLFKFIVIQWLVLLLFPVLSAKLSQRVIFSDDFSGAALSDKNWEWKVRYGIGGLKDKGDEIVIKDGKLYILALNYAINLVRTKPVFSNKELKVSFDLYDIGKEMEGWGIEISQPYLPYKEGCYYWWIELRADGKIKFYTLKKLKGEVMTMIPSSKGAILPFDLWLHFEIITKGGKAYLKVFEKERLIFEVVESYFSKGDHSYIEFGALSYGKNGKIVGYYLDNVEVRG